MDAGETAGRALAHPYRIGGHGHQSLGDTSRGSYFVHIDNTSQRSSCFPDTLPTYVDVDVEFDWVSLLQQQQQQQKQLSRRLTCSGIDG